MKATVDDEQLREALLMTDQYIKKMIGWTKMSLLLIFMPGCQTVLFKGLKGKGGS